MKIAALFLLTLSCSTFALAGERLTGNDLTAFYTEKTLSSLNSELGPTKTYFAANGQVRSQSDSGKVRQGKWWIDHSANTRCVRWDGESQDLCHFTERNSDGTHTLVHGKNGKRLVEFNGSLPGDQLGEK